MDAGVEVLFDDRDIRAGEKFGDSDLIGIPTRVVVSDKNQKEGDEYLLEVKQRATGEVSHMSLSAIIEINK
jgi:prolyl-tRNA synthetase